MHHVEFDPDRLLDEVVTRIREINVPSCPREFAGSTFKPKRFFRRRLVQAVAAILVAVIAGAIWLASPPGISKSAFAQMQDALAATKTLSCRLIQFAPERQPRTSKVMSIGDNRFRVEYPEEVIILNIPEGALMHVNDKARTAVIDPVYTTPEFIATLTAPFKKLRTITESVTEELGERELDGRQVIDFLVKFDGKDQKVTVDAKTKLPVHIEIQNPIGPDGKEIREEITDFVFDAPLDESLFRIEPPTGYEVTDHGRAKTQPAAPKDDASLVISPETGIGPVKFGAKVDEIIRLLGKPDWQKHHDEVVTIPIPKKILGDKKPPTQKMQYTEMNYDSRGFRLSVNDENGLSGIQCFNQRAMGPIAKDFQGKTKEGIRLGATWDEVLKTYGKPWKKSERGSLWYDGGRWVLEFRNDKLCSFRASSFDKIKPFDGQTPQK